MGAKGKKQALATKVANKQAAKAKEQKAMEVKKIETAKELEKIAVKEEAKEVVAKKEEVKKEEVVVEEKKKTTRKSTKKAEKVEKAEKEPKKTTTKKASEKKEPAKKAAPKKKATSKKTTSEKPAKKVNPKKRSLDENFYELSQVGVTTRYEDLTAMLLEEKDNKKIVAKLVEEFSLNEEQQVLAKVVVDQVADTMDIKAKDFAAIKKGMNAAMKQTLGEDGEENAKLYLDMFALSEKILMIGQRKQIHLASEVTAILGSSVEKYMAHFFKVAYDLLPSWQYNDIKFYEDFAYAILSQFDDLYEVHQLDVQMDVADLYIRHGDFASGDAAYNYILRDNQIKDYIYYRFASVYETVDVNRAKGVAYSAMQYVDDRFTYYSQLVEIMNK